MDADQPDVKFPYAAALALARTLWSLAGDIGTKQSSARDPAATTAKKQWTGTYRDDFDQRMRVSDTDAGGTATALKQAAKGLAAQWAQARFQQEQIEYARLVQKKRDSISGWDKFWGTGDQDYGSAPKAPETPTPPEFAATHVPQATVP